MKKSRDVRVYPEKKARLAEVELLSIKHRKKAFVETMTAFSKKLSAI